MAQKERRFPVVLRRADNGFRHNNISAVPIEKHITLLSRWPHRHTIGRRLVLAKE